jgi:hypothetical protein
MTSTTTINGLYSLIEEKRMESVSGKYFITRAKVQEIFTAVKIDLAVGELDCDAPERLGLTNKIKEEGRVVFAILVWMRRADHIVGFRNHECLDSRLPLSENLARRIAPEFGASFAREYQWQFLPYVFDKDMRDYHRVIHESDRILPFIGKIEHIGEGGFGQVSKLTIPTSLQDLIDSKVRAKFSDCNCGVANGYRSSTIRSR